MTNNTVYSIDATFYLQLHKNYFYFFVLFANLNLIQLNWTSQLNIINNSPLI